MEAINPNTSFAKTIHSDHHLFQQIAEGKDSAMNELFRKYYHRLCKFGRMFENNCAIIEEKVADVFIQLWNNRQNLNHIKNPKVYIYVCAKNSFKKISTYDQVHQSFENELLLPLDALLPSIEDDIIQREQQESMKETIKTVLDKIPKKSRKVFELSRINGLKYKEISQLLGISSKTVEIHMATAMRVIRKHIKISS